MTTLYEFRQTRCPKCWASGPSQVRYHSEFVVCTERAAGEHLHRTCKECGYDWATKTHDASGLAHEPESAGLLGVPDDADPL